MKNCDVCKAELSGGIDTFGGVGETLCEKCYLWFAEDSREVKRLLREALEQGFSRYEALMQLRDTPLGLVPLGSAFAIELEEMESSGKSVMKCYAPS